jgi:hypothetical protein
MRSGLYCSVSSPYSLILANLRLAFKHLFFANYVPFSRNITKSLIKSLKVLSSGFLLQDSMSRSSNEVLLKSRWKRGRS